MANDSLQSGDWVRTDTGEVGRVVHVTRLTVFVQLESEPNDASLKAYLMSQLTKIAPPDKQSETPSSEIK
jgi:preprotein translocase subunit YajC